MHDLGEAYRAVRARVAPDLAAPDSFADFAVAEQAYAQTEAHRSAEQYWLSRFATLPAPLDLPVDHPRPRRRGFASRRRDLLLDAAGMRAATQCAARHGASLYALLLSTFAVLLQRLSGQDDLVIGVPAAGQAAAGHEQLVGHAVNILPLRIAVTDTASSAQLIANVRGHLLDAFEHQRYTFGTLLKRLAMPRDPSRLPLVNVLFNLDRAFGQRQADFGDLRFELASVPRSYENFELFINAVQLDDGGLSLECQYNSDLYDDATIEAWLDAYATLLRGIVDDAVAPVDELPMLSAAMAARLDALQPARTPYDETPAGARILRTPGRSRVFARGGARSASALELRRTRGPRQSHRAQFARARGVGAARWSASAWNAASTCSPRCSACSRPARVMCRWIRRSPRSVSRSWWRMRSSRP